MLSPKAINKEHKKALCEMETLVRAARAKGLDFPISGSSDYELYCRLSTIKDVLEWVNPSLVRTDPNGRNRIEHLMGDSYYFAAGPVDTEMIKRRFD